MIMKRFLYLSIIIGLCGVGGYLRYTGWSTALIAIPLPKLVSGADTSLYRDELFHALSHGDVASVVKLIAAGASINATNIDGATPLQLACKMANDAPGQQLVSILLSHHADPNKKDLFGNLPLHMALRVDNSDLRMRIISDLVKNGAWINAFDMRGHSLLDLGTSYRDLAMIQALTVWCGPLFGRDLIVRASAVAGLEAGQGYGYADIGRYLAHYTIDAAAWRACYDHMGITALQGRVLNNDLAGLIACVHEVREDAQEALVAARTQDAWSMTALHLAVLQGNERIVAWLLEHKAAVDAKTGQGDTALHLVAHVHDAQAQMAIVRRLVSAHASMDSKNSAGNTVLHELVIADRVALLQWVLAQRGVAVDTKARNAQGLTPYALAVQLQRHGCAAALR